MKHKKQRKEAMLEIKVYEFQSVIIRIFCFETWKLVKGLNQASQICCRERNMFGDEKCSKCC